MHHFSSMLIMGPEDIGSAVVHAHSSGRKLYRLGSDYDCEEAKCASKGRNWLSFYFDPFCFIFFMSCVTGCAEKEFSHVFVLFLSV